MRVLLVTPFPPMRSPEGDHAYSLCERLAEYGLDIQVVTARGSLPHPRIPVHRILRDWGWADGPRLAWLIRRCRPDAILLVYTGWVYRYHPMMTFVPSIAKRLVPQARVVTWFHVALGTEWPRALLARAVLRGVMWWVGRQGVDLEFGTLFRDSDRIVVPSEGIRAALAERSMDLRRKSVLVPSPQNIRTCPDHDGTIRGNRRRALGLQPDDPLIAYFGYIYPSKGLEYLIEALRIVTRRGHPRARLVIVGGVIPDFGFSYEQRLRDLVRELRLDERVTWAGGFQ